VDARASVTVVEKRRQGRDHPVLLGVPETYYLKCFVLRKLSTGEPAVTARPSRP
jgi:23S rRNA G2069 N7-methylase RlmK/C1962 C5-methylase RlmI